MSDPIEEFRHTISNAEVGQVSHQVGALALRVAALSEKVAVLADRDERRKQDISSLTSKIDEALLLAQPVDELKRRGDELANTVRELATKVSNLAAKENERRGERNHFRFIAALAIGAIGGATNWFLGFFIPHH